MELNKKKPTPVKVSDKYWWLVLLVCFLGWIFIYGTRTILNPIQGEIAADLGLSNSDMGLVNSVFFLTYTILQIPFGGLSDRVGRKVTAGMSLIVLAAMSFFSGIANAFMMFIIVRALAGASQAGYYGPQYALSVEAIPSKYKTLGLAIINSGMAFGTSGGYLLSSKLVLEDGGHWSSPFKIIAIPTLIIGIAFLCLKEYVIRPEDIANKEKSNLENTNGEASNAKLKDIFGNKKLLGVFILVFSVIYANFVILTWLPQFLQSYRGFEGSEVGFIASLIPWASIPAALTMAMIVDRMKNVRKTLNILVIISMIATFGIGFIENRFLFFIVLILYGFTGKLVTDPIMVGFVSELAPKGGLATTLSAYNFIGMSGSILAPYITGWLADSVGNMQVGFYLGALMLILGLLAFNYLVRE